MEGLAAAAKISVNQTIHGGVKMIINTNEIKKFALSYLKDLYKRFIENNHVYEVKSNREFGRTYYHFIKHEMVNQNFKYWRIEQWLEEYTGILDSQRLPKTYKDDLREYINEVSWLLFKADRKEIDEDDVEDFFENMINEEVTETIICEIEEMAVQVIGD